MKIAKDAIIFPLGNKEVRSASSGLLYCAPEGAQQKTEQFISERSFPVILFSFDDYESIAIGIHILPQFFH